MKSRLTYVPDMVAFYPWMTVRDTLEYLASFRKHWNGDIEADLLKRFQLDPNQKASHLSKGQHTQLALIGAICPEPELLVLDEPTSGLDPIVRREFIETVIGAYQSGDPGSRTVFVSTHLISEFEGLIDEFTIIEQGRELLTMEADAARDRFRKIRARFAQPPAQLNLPGALKVKQSGREVEILTNGNSEQLLDKIEIAFAGGTALRIAVAGGNLCGFGPFEKSEGMNALVKKEIRLLLPSGMVAVLLALVQAITRPYDFYVATLLFFGLTIMALTTIGRETSLNTFSLLLAQPAERMRIWQTKLTVLAVAFLIVFTVWLAAFGIAFIHSNVDASDREGSYNLFITICLIAAATFTGGLWTTLLLRQLAGAFWLTLLVPATLSGFSGIFLAGSESDNFVIAILSLVIGIYSIAGFLFARWLFFRAQDVGWSGGVIAMPEWKFLSARAERAGSVRTRKPVFALIKKEFQLQQVSLLGAAGLLALHFGTIVLRIVHHFDEKSVGAILLALFWILWLVMAPIIGSMSVAEERRLGVMEGQLCQPFSRRVQFVIKAFLTLFLGTFLGGVVPVLMEKIGAGMSGGQSVFAQPETDYWGLAIVASAAWLTLVSFFASTLAKNFLQAVGFGVVTFFGCMLLVPLFTSGRMLFLDSISPQHLLPLIVAVPTIIVTLLWLAYLNFNNIRDSWPLARCNAGGIIGALLFMFVSSNALYHRAWEMFEPAEPAHGPAKFSLANPPTLREESYDNLLVRLPGGRVWFDYLDYGTYNYDSGIVKWQWHYLVDPLPKSGGAPRFVAGTNWVSATARHVDFHPREQEAGNKPVNHIVGYLDTVGIRADSTLWISGASKSGAWTGDKMNRFGNGTNWRQVIRSRPGVLLLKNDGTLWRWGTNHIESSSWQTNWPNLRADPLYQIGTDSDWKEIGGSWWNNLARKADGSVWQVGVNIRSGKDELRRDTNLDQVVLHTLSVSGNGESAYVRPDGTLWMSWEYQQNGANKYSSFVQVGKETNWTAVALNWQKMVALKCDGSLWQWRFINPWNGSEEQLILAAKEPPARLGIHDDWVAIANTWEDMIALAADGSLWLWPDREQYEQSTLLKLPKQPEFLGNVFGKAD